MRKLQTKGKWQAAATAAKRPKANGTEAHTAANHRYEDCHTAYAALTSAAAGVLLARLASSMDGLMDQWRDYKRAAALLDFDDLLYTARDLLDHEPVRQALGNRFRHVLVDEFQDTDLSDLPETIRTRLCAAHAGLLSPVSADVRIHQQNRSQLDRLYQRVVDDLDALVGALGLKAA